MEGDGLSYPMLSALPKNDLVVFADDDGDISAVDWDGHIVLNRDTQPGTRTTELIRIPMVAALSGVSYLTTKAGVSMLYIGSTTQCYKATTKEKFGGMLHLGELGSLITKLRVEYKVGKLIGITAESSIKVVHVDGTGFPRFDEVIKRNEAKIREADTRLTVLKESKENLSRQIDQLKSTNPADELKELKKFLRAATEKLSGRYDDAHPTDGLSRRLEEMMSANTSEREAATKVFNRWRNLVQLPIVQLEQKTLDETTSVTDRKIEDLSNSIRDYESRNADFRSKIFSLRNEIQNVCTQVTGIRTNDPESAMTELRSYTYATDLDRRYGVTESRADRAMELLSKIKNASATRVVDDPAEVTRLQKQYSKLVSSCDEKRNTLLLQIEKEKQMT